MGTMSKLIQRLDAAVPPAAPPDPASCEPAPPETAPPVEDAVSSGEPLPAAPSRFVTEPFVPVPVEPTASTDSLSAGPAVEPAVEPAATPGNEIPATPLTDVAATPEAPTDALPAEETVAAPADAPEPEMPAVDEREAVISIESVEAAESEIASLADPPSAVGEDAAGDFGTPPETPISDDLPPDSVESTRVQPAAAALAQPRITAPAADAASTSSGHRRLDPVGGSSEIAPAARTFTPRTPTFTAPPVFHTPSPAARPAPSTRASGFARGPICPLAASSVDAAIIALKHPFSPVAEQIRGSAARLTSMNPEGAPMAIAVTSAARREGKSVFCANLALMLAEGGHRSVVVIDGDLRAGSLASLLGARNDLGLADVLSGDAALTDALQPTSRTGLFVLPAGRGGGRVPGELLAGKTLAETISRLRSEADYVLVDTPAVTTCADATLIARACDAALLVVAAGRTRESVVVEAAATLRGNNIRILGAIMNGCTQRGAS
ncbi:MAG: polysaccharide biosynthesis tyrosine autokinase [Phycisphaerales bacterium]|nr:polysaccharide biosynthesis tyrosine autokinase [Phycisphaerales bacterium]